MKPVILIALGFAALAGCGGGDTTSGPTPTPAVTTSFSQFVKAQVGAPSETAAPVEVEATVFVLPGENEDTVFDDVLPAP